MKNISELDHCYGCGVCVVSCPVEIISMRQTADGFYAPHIEHQDRCIDCGRCVRVCSFCNGLAPRTEPVRCHAGYVRDREARRRASSGGIAHALLRHTLHKGGKALAVRYNRASGFAEHYVIEHEDEMGEASGSKYLQSHTEEALRAIDFKDKSIRWTVVGTPCQIASLRRLLDMRRASERFLLVDIFCHGVPSQHLWTRYLKEYRLEGDNMSWRDKDEGWHTPYVISAFDKEGRRLRYSPWTEGDDFYNIYMGNTCFNRCCYTECKFKSLDSAADLRLGDFWGDRYATDREGVSVIAALSERGRQAIEELRGDCHLEDVTEEDALDGQLTSTLAYPRVARALTIGALRAGVPLRLVALIPRVARHMP